MRFFRFCSLRDFIKYGNKIFRDGLTSPYTINSTGNETYFRCVITRTRKYRYTSEFCSKDIVKHAFYIIFRLFLKLFFHLYFSKHVLEYSFICLLFRFYFLVMEHFLLNINRKALFAIRGVRRSTDTHPFLRYIEEQYIGENK
jgi:hypothetical protein